MVKLSKKEEKYWIVKDFSSIAAWATKNRMPTKYRKFALPICTRFGTAWGINNGPRMFGIEVLEWSDIPAIYQIEEKNMRT